MTGKVIIGAFVAVMLAVKASAQTYVCKMKPDAHDYGWISKTIVVNVNETGDKVLVNDALIQAAYDKPITATIVVNREKRLTIKWEVDGLETVRGVTMKRFMYRLTILKARGNKAILKANPAGYVWDLGASGKCRVGK